MPNGCGIGGDAFWLIWDAATGRQTALNGSGRAPAAADAAAWRRPASRPCRSSGRGRSRRRARCAPGARPTRATAGSRGTRSWPGDRARGGWLPRLGRLHRRGRGERRAVRSSDDLGPRGGLGSVHRPHGRRWRPGGVRLPALARSLERLATAGFATVRGGARARASAPAWPRPARRSPPPTCAPSASTWRSRSASTIAASG